jgi:tetratricopeptide (TPR) repeat protein
MQRALITIFIFIVLGLTPAGTPPAQAFFTPHPLQNYEKGLHELNAYQGDIKSLQNAQQTFTQIIEKHPNSPFGYLGMSQLKTIEAYSGGQRYNIKMITDEAMPMALKAMRTGPTLNMVHYNYDRFEKIFKDNDDNQDYVRRLLFLFPERAETYLSLGNYLTDQGDYEKALEYYKVSLRFAATDEVKLKAVQRIAHIYLKDLSDAHNAVEYYETALSLNGQLPAVWESLGEAYFQLQRYDLSMQNFQKAFDVFKTPQLQTWLLQAKSLMHEQSGDLDLAISVITSVLGDNNQNTSLHRQLANLYYKKSDFKNAYYHFQKVIEAGVADADTFYFAGRSAHSLGQEQQARDYYSQYLHLKSDGVEAEWIRQNIPDLSHR